MQCHIKIGEWLKNQCAYISSILWDCCDEVALPHPSFRQRRWVEHQSSAAGA